MDILPTTTCIIKVTTSKILSESTTTSRAQKSITEWTYHLHLSLASLLGKSMRTTIIHQIHLKVLVEAQIVRVLDLRDHIQLNKNKKKCQWMSSYRLVTTR